MDKMLTQEGIPLILEQVRVRFQDEWAEKYFGRESKTIDTYLVDFMEHSDLNLLMVPSVLGYNFSNLPKNGALPLTNVDTNYGMYSMGGVYTLMLRQLQHYGLDILLPQIPEDMILKIIAIFNQSLHQIQFSESSSCYLERIESRLREENGEVMHFLDYLAQKANEHVPLPRTEISGMVRTHGLLTYSMLARIYPAISTIPFQPS